MKIRLNTLRRFLVDNKAWFKWTLGLQLSPGEQMFISIELAKMYGPYEGARLE